MRESRTTGSTGLGRGVLLLFLALIALVAYVVFPPIEIDGTQRAFEQAILDDDYTAVVEAIEAGADVNDPIVDRNLRRFISKYAVTYRYPPLVRAITGDFRIVTALLEAGAEVDAQIVPGGETAMGICLKLRGWDAARASTLLENGADPMRVRGRVLDVWHDRSKPNRHHLTFKLFQEWIAREVRGESADSRGVSPLIEAARRGDEREVGRLLESGADPDQQDGDGWTPLLWACSEVAGDEAIVHMLLDAGADPSLGTRLGYTPLMAATHGNARRYVEILLDAGAETNGVEAVDGDSALLLASSFAGLPVVERLLEGGSDVLTRDRAARTVVDRARTNRTDDAAEVLELLQAEWNRAFRARVPDEVVLLDPIETDKGPGKLWVGEIGLREGRSGTEAHGSVWVSNNEVALAFDIFWSAGDEQWLVGSFAAEYGSVRAFSYTSSHAGDLPGRVDVTLYPNSALARRELISREIWGEPIRLGSYEVR